MIIPRCERDAGIIGQISGFPGSAAAGRGMSSCKIEARNPFEGLISGIDRPNRVNSRSNA